MADASTPPDLMLGTHEIWFEDDLVVCKVHGVFTLADMQNFAPIADAHNDKHGYGLVLSDISDATGLTAEARRFAAGWNREAQKRGPLARAHAIYGGNMLMRGVAALFIAVVRVVGGTDLRSHLAGTEAEGRAFLAEQRRVFQAQRGQRAPGQARPEKGG